MKNVDKSITSVPSKEVEGKKDCRTCSYWRYDYSPLCDKCCEGSKYTKKEKES